MNRYLISVAALALMAAPAFAQDHEHGGGPGGGGGHPGGGAPHAAPGGAPHGGPGGAPHGGPGGGGPRGDFHGGGPRPAAAPAAPAAAPQFNHGDRGNGGRPNPGFANQNNGRPGAGNRPGAGPGNRPGGAGNHPVRPPNAPRPNFSNFHDYHRNFSASRRFHAPAYRRPSGWYYRRWTFGEFLPALFWANQYWLNDYDEYDLPPPPPGTVWVRYGDDALLIDRYTGEIITVEYGVFY